MKKYILSFICIVLAVTAYGANERVTLPAKPIKISINFWIARPALGCDGGFGICNWNFGVGRLGGDGREVSAEAWVENGQLIVQILKNYIDDKMDYELKNSNYYNIQEEIAIPPMILEKLGLKDSYSVAEGNYRIIEYGEYYETTFELK